MTDTPKTNVQKLTSLFTGKPAGNSAVSALALADAIPPTGNKRGRSEDHDPANPVFTKLDLFDMLDEQEDNYKKNTEVSIADALETFGKKFQAVAKSDTKELLGKFHDKLDSRFQCVETRLTKLKLQQRILPVNLQLC